MCSSFPPETVAKPHPHPHSNQHSCHHAQTNTTPSAAPIMLLLPSSSTQQLPHVIHHPREVDSHPANQNSKTPSPPGPRSHIRNHDNPFVNFACSTADALSIISPIPTTPPASTLYTDHHGPPYWKGGTRMDALYLSMTGIPPDRPHSHLTCLTTIT